MDSTAYLYIYKLLMEAKNNDILEVHKSELKSCFKMLRRLMRERGWLGYDDDGRLQVNRKGLVEVIKSLYKRDFEHFGTILSVDVQMDCIHDVKVIGRFEGGWVFSHHYNINYVQECANISLVEE